MTPPDAPPPIPLDYKSPAVAPPPARPRRRVTGLRVLAMTFASLLLFTAMTEFHRRHGEPMPYLFFGVALLLLVALKQPRRAMPDRERRYNRRR